MGNSSKPGKQKRSKAQVVNGVDAGKTTTIDPKVLVEQVRDRKADDVTIDPPLKSVEGLPSDGTGGGNQERGQPGFTPSTPPADIVTVDGPSANTIAALETSKPSSVGGQEEASSVERTQPNDRQPIDVGKSIEPSKEMEPESAMEGTTEDSQQNDYLEQQQDPDGGFELPSIEPSVYSDDGYSSDQASDIAVVGSSTQDLTDDGGIALPKGADVSVDTQVIDHLQGRVSGIEVGNNDGNLGEEGLDKLAENTTAPIVPMIEELGKMEGGPANTTASEEPTKDATQSQSDSLQDSSTSDGPRDSTQSSEDLPSSSATSANIAPEASVDLKEGENAIPPERIVEAPDSGHPGAEKNTPVAKSSRKKKSEGKNKKKKKSKRTPVDLGTENQIDKGTSKKGTSNFTSTSEASAINEAPQTSASVEDPTLKAASNDRDTSIKSTEDPAPQAKDNEDSGSPASRAEEADQGTGVTNEEQTSHTEAVPVAVFPKEHEPQGTSAPDVAEKEAKEEESTGAGNADIAEVSSEQPMEGEASQDAPPDKTGSTDAPIEEATPEEAASGLEGTAEKPAEEAANEPNKVDDAVSPDEAGSAKDAPLVHEDSPAGDDASASQEAVVTEHATPAEEAGSTEVAVTVQDTVPAEATRSAEGAPAPAEGTASTEEGALPDKTSPGDDTGPTGDAATGGEVAPAEEIGPADGAAPVGIATAADDAVTVEEATPKEAATLAEEGTGVEGATSGHDAPAEGNAPANEAVPAESAPAEEGPPPEDSAPAAEAPSTEEATPADPTPAEEAAPADKAAPADAGPAEEVPASGPAAPAEGEPPAEGPAAAPSSPKSGSSGRRRRRRSSIFGLEFVMDDPRPQRKRRQSDAIIPSTKARSVQDSPRDRQRKRRYSEANYKTIVRPAEDEKQHRRKSKESSQVIKKAKTEPIPKSADPEPTSSKVEDSQPVDRSSRRHRGERRMSVYRDPSPRPAMMRLFSNMSGKSDTKPPLWVSTTNKESKGPRPKSSRRGSSHHHRSPEEKEASKARRDERRAKEESPPEPNREERRSRREEKRPAPAEPADPPKASSSSQPKGSSDRKGRSEQAQTVTIKNMAMSGFLKKLFVY